MTIKKFKFPTLTILILAVIFSTIPILPSQAMFGLSKCEKVRKQILSMQVGESFLAAGYEPANGVSASIFSSDDANFYRGIWTDIVNWEVSMYKFETQNLKCFSTSQIIFINKAYPSWKSWITTSGVVWNLSNFPQVSWDSIYNK